MAVRSLPRRERRIGIAGGAAAAVVLRIALTWFAARLLTVQYVQLLGGLFVVWIALKVLADASDPPDSSPAPAKFYQAIWYIVVADLTMSTDNILAIAGASKNNVWLIVFGLCLSIPFVVLSSNLLADLMEKYPWTVYLGSVILGKVGGEMIMTDPFVVRTLHPTDALRYATEVVLVAAVVVGGKALSAARLRRAAVPEPDTGVPGPRV
jgi:YjbE family integral membrane protein